jgi:hypothetical protein
MADHEKIHIYKKNGDINSLLELLEVRKIVGICTWHMQVADALGKIGDSKAIEPLIKALEDDFMMGFTSSIAEALKKITDQDFGTDAGKWHEWWQSQNGDDTPLIN